MTNQKTLTTFYFFFFFFIPTNQKKKSTDASRRRKKNSTTPGKDMKTIYFTFNSYIFCYFFIVNVTSVPSIPCKLPWKLKLRARLRLFVWRRSLSLTSTSSKLLLIIPIRPTLTSRSTLRSSRVRWRTSSPASKKSTVWLLNTANSSALLNAAPTPSTESSKNPEPSLNSPTAAADKLRLNSAKPLNTSTSSLPTTTPSPSPRGNSRASCKHSM